MQKQDYPREFHYRLIPVKPGRAWVLFTLLSMVLPLLMLFAIGGLDVFSGDSGQPLLSPLEQAVLIAMLLALVVMLGFAIWEARVARLRVDESGLRCDPPQVNGRTTATPYPWRLGWSDVKRAVLYLPPSRTRGGLRAWAQTTLALESQGKEYRLALLYWESPREPFDRRMPILPWRVRSKLESMARSHPLLAALEARGISVEVEALTSRVMHQIGRRGRAQRDEAEAAGHVDLLAYPGLVALLGVMVLMLAFAALHYLVLPPLRAMWHTGFWIPLLGGLGTFVLAAAIAARAPVRERLAVAALIGALGAALWTPAELRLLAMRNGAGVDVPYVATQPGVFAPQAGSYPVIDLRDLEIPEYWSTYPPGAEHPFRILSVGKGRYVLLMAPLFQRTRAFYDAE